MNNDIGTSKETTSKKDIYAVSIRWYSMNVETLELKTEGHKQKVWNI